MNKPKTQDYNFKIVIIGDSNAGKTNILTRFCHNQFSLEPKVTVGVEFASKFVRAYDDQISLQIWDTCGQENFRAITGSFYKGAIGALIVFDLTRRSTFDNLEKWYKEVKENAEENASILIVGNKSDLSNLREVKYEEGAYFAESRNIAYIETSALDSTNIETAFKHVTTEIYNMFLQYGVYDDPNEEKLSSRSLKLKSGEIKDKKACCE